MLWFIQTMSTELKTGNVFKRWVFYPGSLEPMFTQADICIIETGLLYPSGLTQKGRTTKRSISPKGFDLTQLWLLLKLSL